ncbi:NAD(+)/NADH kinase [Halegenticoccus soli]|uniref:NAD(+)/NADH kinase n=1 Tax=Halegenticoccus soli TaxID=1985678 RepID=UPI000C6CDB6B|nr:NAD(+)/NADH kinase [Halegenticoccus soli]
MRVALRGDGGGVRRALADAAPDVEFVAPDGADAVVAVGERALVDAALARPSAPIVPIGVGGRYSLPAEEFDRRVDSFLAGEWSPSEHPLLSVEVDGAAVAEAFLDVTLITSEPARISEYSVSVDDERVDAFRSDGVVVATPAGSTGYARAARGPILLPGTGLVVVPVSPFATRSERWVVPAEVTLSVERDDGAVSLVVDGRERGEVGPHEPVRVVRSDAVSLLRPPARP